MSVGRILLKVTTPPATTPRTESTAIPSKTAILLIAKAAAAAEARLVALSARVEGLRAECLGGRHGSNRLDERVPARLGRRGSHFGVPHVTRLAPRAKAGQVPRADDAPKVLLGAMWPYTRMSSQQRVRKEGRDRTLTSWTEAAIVIFALAPLRLGVAVEVEAFALAAGAHIAIAKGGKEATLGHGPHVKLVQVVTAVAFFAEAAQPVLADGPLRPVSIVRRRRKRDRYELDMPLWTGQPTRAVP